MNFITVIADWDGIYGYKEASNVEMTLLGRFFTDDVGCGGRLGFRNWALVSDDGAIATGNASVLEREMDDILLSDQYSVEPIPTVLRMTVKQSIDLFDEWQEKVVKKRPKRVVIKHDEDFFWMQTFDH